MQRQGAAATPSVVVRDSQYVACLGGHGEMLAALNRIGFPCRLWGPSYGGRIPLGDTRFIRTLVSEALKSKLLAIVVTPPFSHNEISTNSWKKIIRVACRFKLPLLACSYDAWDTQISNFSEVMISGVTSFCRWSSRYFIRLFWMAANIDPLDVESLHFCCAGGVRCPFADVKHRKFNAQCLPRLPVLLADRLARILVASQIARYYNEKVWSFPLCPIGDIPALHTP